MAFPDLDPVQVFRDFATDKVPTSGKWNPRKPEIRRLLKSYESAIIALIAGQGGDIDLARGVISFAVTGGTANDIIAEPDAELPENPGAAVFILGGIEQSNTGNVTINGKPLLTNSGNQIAAGGLVADGIYLFLDDGTSYRLVSDQASAAIVAAAEQAALDAQEQTVLASNEADRAEAAANVSSGVASAFIIAENTFATKTTVEAWHPVAAPDFIRVAGYTSVDDGGGAQYKNVGSSEPSHDAKFPLLLDDGVTTVWFELNEPVIRVEMLGAKPSPFDSKGAFDKAFAVLGEVASKLEAHGDYSFSGPVTATIRDNVTVDFTGAHFRPLFSTMQNLFDVSGIRSASFTTTLSGDAIAGAERISVSSLDGIEEGQIVQIFSREWFDVENTKRTYETNRVRGVDAGYVYLDAPLLADFTSAGDISGGGDGTVTLTFITAAKNLLWIGGTYYGQKTVDRCISAMHLNDAVFSDLTIDKAGYYGLYVQGCSGPVVQNSRSYDHGRNVALSGNYGSGSFGYGFIHTHCCFARVVNCIGGRGWHTFDASDGVRDVTYIDCKALSDTYGFSTHRNCISARYENCTTEGKHGHTHRARYVSIDGGRIVANSLQSIGCTQAVRELHVRGVEFLGTSSLNIYTTGVSVSSPSTVPQIFVVESCVFANARGITIRLHAAGSKIFFRNNYLLYLASVPQLELSANLVCFEGNLVENISTAGITATAAAVGDTVFLIRNNSFFGERVSTGASYIIDTRGQGISFYIEDNKIDVTNVTRLIRILNSDTHSIKRICRNEVVGPQRVVTFSGATTLVVEYSAFNSFLTPGFTDYSGTTGVTVTHRHQDFVVT